MFDYHMHSRVSFDGHHTGLAMAQAAVANGLKEICFTDHLDYDPLGQMGKLDFDTDAYNAEYDHLEIPGLKIRRGAEFGMDIHNLAQFQKDLQRRHFDYVLGSVHFVDDLDVYYEGYWRDKTVFQAERRYLEATLETVRLHNDFDVLAHLTYIGKTKCHPAPRAVPFDEQAKMMIESLGLKAGDLVGVLYCSSETNSLIQYEAVKKLFEAEGIEAKAYTFSEATELQAVVNSMVAECKAVYIPSDNTVASNDGIVGTICSEKKIPVYTSYGGEICYASLAIDYYALGQETGKMAAQILLGNKAPSDYEIATLTPTVTYNKELCDKLGIAVPEN